MLNNHVSYRLILYYGDYITGGHTLDMLEKLFHGPG